MRHNRITVYVMDTPLPHPHPESASVPDPEKDRKASKPSPHALWISVVWAVLFLKCGLLTEGIIHYKAPIDPIWIWAPTYVAALVLTGFLLSNKSPVR